MKYDSDKYREIAQARIDAGKLIDPKTAKLDWGWAQVLDPYGDGLEIPEEGDCVGREYFLRAPGSDVWVNTSDLPGATCDEFWRLLSAGYYKARPFPWPWTESDPVAAMRAAEKEGK
jgi:hypothetical protein